MPALIGGAIGGIANLIGGAIGSGLFLGSAAGISLIQASVVRSAALLCMRLLACRALEFESTPEDSEATQE